MTKENAHLYLPLVQALADGKTIQLKPDCQPWEDMRDGVLFGSRPDRYRIKPEPVMVPLGPEDIPHGSVFRCHNHEKDSWLTPQAIYAKWVCLIGLSIDYATLLKDGWLIKRPGQDWQPCSKPA